MRASHPAVDSFPRISAPERLRALARHDLPAHEQDEPLTHLVRLAADILNVPIVALNVIDAHRQVTHAINVGSSGTLELSASFCAHIVERGAPAFVTDVRLDPTFRDLPMAQDGTVVAYAAVPLLASDGQALGTLCAVDVQPRTFTPAEQDRLTAFTRLAQTLLAQRVSLKETSHEREQLRALLEAVPLATFATDAAGRLTIWNRAAETLYGYGACEVLGRPTPELWAGTPGSSSGTAAGATHGIQEERRVTRAGRHFDARYHRAELRDIDGNVTLVVDTTADVTERKRAQALLEQQARVLEDMSEAVISCDEHFRLLTWNPAATRMYGWTPEELQGLDLRDVIPTDFGAPDEAAFLRSVGERGLWDGQVVQSHKSGRKLHIHCRMTLLRHPDGREAGLIIVNEDVTEQVATQARLEHLAYTDLVTGLANRQALLRFLHDAHPDTPRGALFIDLDDFKGVNDLHGHADGDAVLVEAAARLRRAAPDAFAARISGDEFVLVTSDVEELLTLAGNVRRVLDEPWKVGARSLRLTASVGAARTTSATTPTELLRRADIAMYAAKTAGKNRFMVYDERTDEARHERAQLATDLTAGLARGELTLAWQPRVDLNDGRVVAVEALARWPHPTRGLLPPGVFIPVAEESGVIHELGREVLRQACAQGRAWAEAGTPVTVAVNVSAAELSRDSFVQDMRDALSASGLPPRLLEVEVTETTAMRDLHVNAARLRALTELGVSVAIDDFGTGYSSLSYLRHLPAQVVKIDRAFVRDLAEDATGMEASIVRAVVTLAHGVGMRVVAEGVETDEQRRVLLALGCEEAQGFFFARPQDAALVSGLLERAARRDG